jgi:hypothetical protein
VNWITTVVAIVAALGVGGWVSSFFERRHASDEANRARVFAADEARAERQHASDEARAERLWPFRLETYGAASLYLERLAAVLDRTDPIAPKPDPPQMKPDEEWLELASRVAIGCSETVQKAMREAVRAHTAFEGRRKHADVAV